MNASHEIWVHDVDPLHGIGGVIPPAAGRTVIRIDRTWPTMSVASEIQSKAHATGGASVLWFVFHASTANASLTEAEGGWEDYLFGGLSELGRDGVFSSNVAAFGLALRGLFSDSIRLLACGAAARWNGMEICRRLAFHSQTVVIASQDSQEYTTNARGEIDVGVWEGRVFKFLPNGEAVEWFVGPTASGSMAPTRSVMPRVTGR
ncbi:MAG TPA: hypothetical protein VMG60_19500 [Burkholderiaceae bacterium]|nr:hypothetical protein [Burkholderiaceae bacterium]